MGKNDKIKIPISSGQYFAYFLVAMILVTMLWTALRNPKDDANEEVLISGSERVLGGLPEISPTLTIRPECMAHAQGNLDAWSRVYEAPSLVGFLSPDSLTRCSIYWETKTDKQELEEFIYQAFENAKEFGEAMEFSSIEQGYLTNGLVLDYMDLGITSEVVHLINNENTTRESIIELYTTLQGNSHYSKMYNFLDENRWCTIYCQNLQEMPSLIK